VSRMAKKNKDDVMVVSIVVGTMPAKKLKEMKKKTEMAYGGMANGKKHMYSAGGNVTDKLPNKGLQRLASTTKGREAVRNMGFDV